MVREEFRNLRLKQLDRALKPFQKVREVPRPAKGWLRALREALGISAAEFGRMLKTTRQLPLQMEKAEAEDRITLKSLRAAAAALDCDLVYAIVPRQGSIRSLRESLAEDSARTAAAKRVRLVEHSMAIEEQSAGRIGEAVEAETRRLLKKRSR